MINPESRSPQTKEDLRGYRLRDLQALAKRCRVRYTGLKKDELAGRVAEYLSQPFTHRGTVVASR